MAERHPFADVDLGGALVRGLEAGTDLTEKWRRTAAIVKDEEYRRQAADQLAEISEQEAMLDSMFEAARMSAYTKMRKAVETPSVEGAKLWQQSAGEFLEMRQRFYSMKENAYKRWMGQNSVNPHVISAGQAKLGEIADSIEAEQQNIDKLLSLREYGSGVSAREQTMELKEREVGAKETQAGAAETQAGAARLGAETEAAHAPGRLAAEEGRVDVEKRRNELLADQTANDKRKLDLELRKDLAVEVDSEFQMMTEDQKQAIADDQGFDVEEFDSHVPRLRREELERRFQHWGGQGAGFNAVPTPPRPPPAPKVSLSETEQTILDLEDSLQGPMNLGDATEARQLIRDLLERPDVSEPFRAEHESGGRRVVKGLKSWMKDREERRTGREKKTSSALTRARALSAGEGK